MPFTVSAIQHCRAGKAVHGHDRQRPQAFAPLYGSDYAANPEFHNMSVILPHNIFGWASISVPEEPRSRESTQARGQFGVPSLVLSI